MTVILSNGTDGSNLWSWLTDYYGKNEILITSQVFTVTSREGKWRGSRENRSKLGGYRGRRHYSRRDIEPKNDSEMEMEA